MSTSPETVAEPQSAPAATGAAIATAVLNTIGMTLLFGSEIGFMAVSLDLSIAGLLHAGPAVYLPLGAVLAGLAGWATALAAMRAWRYERGAGRRSVPAGSRETALS